MIPRWCVLISGIMILFIAGDVLIGSINTFLNLLTLTSRIGLIIGLIITLYFCAYIPIKLAYDYLGFKRRLE